MAVNPPVKYPAIECRPLMDWVARLGTASALFKVNVCRVERGLEPMGDAGFRIWLRRRVPADTVQDVEKASRIPAAQLRPDLYG